MKKTYLYLLIFLLSIILNTTLFSQSITKTEIPFDQSNLTFTEWQKTDEGYTIGLFTDHYKHLFQNFEFTIAFDENFEFLWAKRFFKSSGFTKMHDMVVDYNNDILALARGDDTRSYLTKIDSDGDVVWKISYHLENLDLFRLYGLLPINSRSNIMYGGLCSLEDFLVKIDSAGQVEWVKEYDFVGSISNAFRDAHLIDDNSICMLADDNFFSLLYLDSIGNLQNNKSYSWSDNSVIVNKLIRNRNGDFIIIAQSDGNNFIIKTDVNGEIIWANQYTHPDFAQINDIAEISNNHYLITASLRFPGDFEFEGVVYIIDDEGEIYWSGKNGNPQNAGQDFYNGIYSDPDGELIIGGLQESNDNLRYIYRSSDFTLTKDFLCELDSISIDKIDITNELVLENPTIQINTANVEVSIVGMTVSTLNNLELIDVCTQDLSVNNQEVEVAKGLNISPNPFDEFLSIESELTGNVKVELFDMLGKQISVEEINLNKGVNNLSVSDLKTGMYIITIRDGNAAIILSEKIVRL